MPEDSWALGNINNQQPQKQKRMNLDNNDDKRIPYLHIYLMVLTIPYIPSYGMVVTATYVRYVTWKHGLCLHHLHDDDPSSGGGDKRRAGHHGDILCDTECGSYFVISSRSSSSTSKTEIFLWSNVCCLGNLLCHCILINFEY